MNGHPAFKPVGEKNVSRALQQPFPVLGGSYFLHSRGRSHNPPWLRIKNYRSRVWMCCCYQRGQKTKYITGIAKMSKNKNSFSEIVSLLPPLFQLGRNTFIAEPVRLLQSKIKTIQFVTTSIKIQSNGFRLIPRAQTCPLVFTKRHCKLMCIMSIFNK